jgi:hypothetical protein
MGRDTDGTNWITVRYTVDVQVMAETADDAIYLAELALPDAQWSIGEVIEL